jgi:hypothetical protein
MDLVIRQRTILQMIHTCFYDLFNDAVCSSNIGMIKNKERE